MHQQCLRAQFPASHISIYIRHSSFCFCYNPCWLDGQNEKTRVFRLSDKVAIAVIAREGEHTNPRANKSINCQNESHQKGDQHNCKTTAVHCCRRCFVFLHCPLVSLCTTYSCLSSLLILPWFDKLSPTHKQMSDVRGHNYHRRIGHWNVSGRHDVVVQRETTFMAKLLTAITSTRKRKRTRYNSGGRIHRRPLC